MNASLNDAQIAQNNTQNAYQMMVANSNQVDVQTLANNQKTAELMETAQGVLGQGSQDVLSSNTAQPNEGK